MRSTPQRRNSKSTANKRKLPDCDQILYFRMGFSSIFTGKSFTEQFSDFWHALPSEIRGEDDAYDDPNAPDEPQLCALDEDEYKHGIRALPHLPTADLVVPPPHCLIRDKIEAAVAHYQREHQNKGPWHLEEDGRGNEQGDQLDLSKLQTTQQSKKKRRLITTTTTTTTAAAAAAGADDNDTTTTNNNNDDDLRRRRGKRMPKQEFVVDDNDELEILQPLGTSTVARKSWNRDKQEMDADDDDEDDLFVIKSEEANTSNGVAIVDENESTPRRSARVRARGQKHAHIENAEADAHTHAAETSTSVPASPSKTVEEMKENLAQFEQHENEEPILRRRRGAPKNNSNRQIPVSNEEATPSAASGEDAELPEHERAQRRPKRKHTDMETGESNTTAATPSPSNSKSPSKGLGARTKFTHDRPHVLFAANVEMPFYDQLIVPFHKLQQRRKQYKAVQSKKEINSITKLTRNHRLQCVEAEKGCKLLREHQCLLQVSIFHSNKSSERYTKSHEYVVLSNQKLSELKDALYCLSDSSPVAKNLKNSFFFIEDTFYDDMRHDSAMRLSDEIVQWSKSDEHWKQTGVYLQKDMEHVKFEDLNIRLGSHYLYCHHGDCQHVLIFTDCRIATKWDCRNSYAYPVCTFRQILKRQKCGVCEMYPAKFVTYDDKHTPVNPFFFCERCYHPFHYDQHGELLYDDFKVFDYVHD